MTDEINFTEEQIAALLAGQEAQQGGGTPAATSAPTTGGYHFGQSAYEGTSLPAGATAPGGLTRAQLEQMIGKKIISMTGEPAYIDVPDPETSGLTKKKVENPDKSTVTITFAGGAQMKARDLGDQSYGIVSSGDAFKGATAGSRSIINTDTSDQYIVTMNPDGTLTKELNPNYRAPGSAGSASEGNALGWAQLAWSKERAAIQDAFENRKINLEEAKARLTEASSRIQYALQQRGQQVEMRGQDITKRGQDVDYAQSLSNKATDAATAMMRYTTAPGTAEDTAGIMNAFGQMGYGKPNTLPTFQPRAASLPFDPATFGLQIAAQALAQISPAAAQMTSVPNVDTTLPNIFTAPQAGAAPPAPVPAASPAVQQAVQQVPAVAAQQQPAFTAPTLRGGPQRAK